MTDITPDAAPAPCEPTSKDRASVLEAPAAGPAAVTTASGYRLGSGGPGGWGTRDGIGGHDPRRPRGARRPGARDHRVRAAAALLSHVAADGRQPARGPLRRLARNEPVDPNDRTSGAGATTHAGAVLRRHGRHAQRRPADAPPRSTRSSTGRPPPTARRPRLDGTDHDPPSGLDDRAAPRARHAAARPRRPGRAGCTAPTSAARSPAGSASPSRQADDLSRLGARAPRRRSTPTTCAAGGSPRRPGSRSPPSSSTRSTGSSGRSACSSSPARAAAAGSSPRCSRSTRSGWSPRSAGELERDLRSASLPAPRRSRAARADQHAHAARRPAGVPGLRRPARAGAHARARHAVIPGVPRGQARPLGPAARHPPQPTRAPDGTTIAELALRVLTFPAREFSAAARLGAVDDRRTRHARAR